MGVMAGSITWAGLTLTGLGLVISRLPQVYGAMRFVGAAYLIWLGGKMAWKAGAPMQSVAAVASGFWISARRAWLVNMTNPKSLAYYASVFAVLVPAHAPIWVYATAMGVTSLISCVWYCGIAWLLSGEAARRAFFKARPAMETVIGLFLVGIGIRMFVIR